MYDGPHPSDLDMYYLTRDNFLIIGEFKNETGKLDSQKYFLERLINGWKHDGLVFYMTHDSYVQNGDGYVDVPACYVKEIYWKQEGVWRTPKRPTKVEDILAHYGLYRKDKRR